MPKFYYKARIKGGALTQGEIEAQDPWLARKALVAQGMIVLEVNQFALQSIVSAFRDFSNRRAKKVTLEEKLMLINQLETGVSIGIPILQVLSFVQEQTTNLYVKEVLIKIGEEVSQGSNLHQAFEKHPVLFDSLAVGLVRTGEATGQLEATLGRLSQIIEQQAKNRSKIKSATFYPKIVIGFMVVVIFVVNTFIIPKFKQFLKGMGQDLPPITQVVMGASDFFVAYWYLILAGGGALYYGFKRYVATPAGRLKVDQLLLRSPLVGNLLMEMELNNYCTLLDLLLASGLTLFESFSTLKVTQSNQVIRNEIDRCAVLVEKGGSLGAALKSGKVFPVGFTSMVATGEESGQLPKVLKRLGRYYQIQIDFHLDTLAKMIEPILLGFIFVMVGILALSIFLPIWKMSSSLH